MISRNIGNKKAQEMYKSIDFGKTATMKLQSFNYKAV